VAKRSAVPSLSLEAAWQSFDRSLRAEGRSPETRRSYASAVAQFSAYLRARSLSLDVAAIRRENLEGWIISLVESRKPATAATRHRALSRLFAWLVSEGELAQSPMQGMHAPKVPDDPPAVLSLDDLRRLLAVCRGTGFDERRDAAILRVLIDTGVRLAELAGLTLADVDLDEGLAMVTGKGRRRRAVPLGAKATAALDRYLRVRAGHPGQRTPALWLGQKGPMAAGGIRQAVQRRARQAGLDQRIWPHLFRHTGAHQWLAAGGSEGDLMSLYGWRSSSMLRRYGSSAAAERARKAHAELSLGDRV
jgi:site-specific recombinase XerD